MKTAIVLAADQTYLPAACCAVISCRRAGRVTEPIFILVSDISDAAVDAARRFLKKRRADAEIVRLSIDLSDYHVDQWISPAAYTRLHLDDILDAGWDRVLYLDSDIRVLTPLSPLLQADLDGRVLGAVEHFGDNPRYQQRLQMVRGSRYFNSGVLLFDWPAVLSSGLLAQSRRFAIENRHLCKMWDQDALNNVFDGLWTPLHLRWNYGPDSAKRFPFVRPSIKHYTHKDKPWGSKKQPFWVADSLWYWHCLRKSPWPNFAHQITVPDIKKGLQWLYRKRYSKHLHQLRSVLLMRW